MSSNISTIAPQLRGLQAPAPLCELPGWLLWRYEPRFDNDPKPIKLPMWADGTRRYGQQGSAHDRSKLTTFTMAREATVRLGADGVGFALLPDWGITALDFDNCIGPNGEMPPEVAHFAARTYTERSPSGKGVRVFLAGDLGNHKAKTTETDFGFETFASTGFVTLTGDILDATDLLGLHNTIAPVDDFATELCARRFGGPGPAQDPDDFMAGHEPRLGLSTAEMEQLLDNLDPGAGRDEWIRVGMALHHETEGDDTGLELWNEWSSSGHNYVGFEDLQKQWDNFDRRKDTGRRQVTMATVKAMVRETLAEEARRLASVEGVRAASEAAATQSTGLSTPADFMGKFPIVSAATMSYQKPPVWLIKGVLPQADFIVLYGASTAGKSFVAISMAAAIARGVDWFGNKVRKGRVLILTAEGAGGFGKRLKAYCLHHGIDIESLDIAVMASVPNILEADDVTELATSISAAGGFDLVIVDTLAQVTPGANENAGEDMGRAIANLRTLREVTGATMLAIHHAGKDLTRGSRGWSGIRAAADAEIEITRDEVRNYREIHIGKQKDGEDGARYGFKLETLVVGMDEDGDEYTSCVAVETEVAAPQADDTVRRGVKRRGRMESHIAEMVLTLDPALTAVPMADLVTLCAEALPAPDPGKRDTRRQVIARAIQTLAREKDSPVKVVGTSVVLYE